MTPRPPLRARRLLAAPLCALLGVAAALLVSCGSSNPKLIPLANSEPLQKDFEEVAHAAENAHGSCSATETALHKAESDLAGLPSSVDAGLRRRLGQGIERLRADALELCTQPSTQTTSSQTTTQTTPTTTTQTTPTTKTETTPTTKTETTPEGGGTPAEGEESAKHDHKGNGGERGATPGGGAAAGGGE